MVFDNYFIHHIPEDCIIDGFIFDCKISSVDLVSLSDTEDSEADVISITDTEVDLELPVLAVGARDSQPASTPAPASDDEGAPQAITLQQVMMTAPIGTSSALTAPIVPNTSQAASTHVGLSAPPPV